MANFVMPALGADMDAGRLIAWMKKPGETVHRGEILAEIDTDKGVIEVECFVDGVIEKQLIEPGAKVPVGTVLATIREEKEEEPFKQAPPVAAEHLKISPLARKMALEAGLDPAAIAGTGPGGRITREDIERAIAGRKAAPIVPESAAPDADRGARMRQAIAAAMARSKREIPHYYLSTKIDMSRAMAWLADENQKRAVQDRLLYGVLLLKAVALALRQFPELNGFWKDDRAVQSPRIHAGVAIALRGGGLIAPAIHDADQQSLNELMKKLHDLVARARTEKLRASEVSDPTITVTSLGEQGVETVFGVIYPPQLAIVGFGKVVERPWAVNGLLGIRPVMTATLAADHRATDGHRGALFLDAIDRLLQEPEKL